MTLSIFLVCRRNIQKHSLTNYVICERSVSTIILERHTFTGSHSVVLVGWVSDDDGRVDRQVQRGTCIGCFDIWRPMPLAQR